MDYMLLISRRRDEAPRENIGFPEMGKYNAELRSEGRTRGGAPLQPEEEGVRLRVTGGRRELVDGPFAETKEVIGGFFIYDAKDDAEALALAKRCPAARSAFVELHPAMREVGDPPPAPGTRFLLIFVEDGKLTDPDGAKYREMTKWTDALKRERVYVECAGLAKDPAGWRIETHGSKTTVTDGPFAEAKEVVGGYALVTAKDLAAALEIAARCPHATWGVVEVREIMNVPPM